MSDAAHEPPPDQPTGQVAGDTALAAASADATAATTEKPATTSGGKQAPPAIPPRAKAGPGAFVLLLVFAAIALSAYDYWLLQARRAEQAAMSQTLASAQQQIATLQQLAGSQQALLTEERRVREQLSADLSGLTTTVKNLSARVGRTSVGWRLLEVDYLLSLAHQRLALARDKNSVLLLLEYANESLRRVSDPEVQPVRRALAEEIARVRALQEPDITGLALTLGGLAGAVSELPLADKKRLATSIEMREHEAALGWRDLPRAIWEDLKNLVRVRRHDQPIEPLLTIQEEWYLYQNLRLKLEQARLAVMQRNNKLLQQTLGEADAWLLRYFDTESAAVSNLRAGIANLKKTEVQPPVPDITQSRRLLHEYQAQLAARAADARAMPSGEADVP